MNQIRLRNNGEDIVVRLEDYDSVIPDGAQRVRALIESEAAHRRLIASRQRQYTFSMPAGMFVGCFTLLAAALVRAC